MIPPFHLHYHWTILQGQMFFEISHPIIRIHKECVIKYAIKML